jgi:hypothetical protein
VDLTVELEAPHPPEVVFPWVAELERYPAWLDIVTGAVADGDGAWLVDLRGRLGPLARRKRIRMARVAVEAPHTVRFERAELDGRDHAAWVLEASVAATATGSHLDVRLHYSGGLFAPVLEKLLAEEIECSKARLLQALATPA